MISENMDFSLRFIPECKVNTCKIYKKIDSGMFQGLVPLPEACNDLFYMVIISKCIQLTLRDGVPIGIV